MPRLASSLPRYRLHRASGQAIVTLYGRDFYLGPHGTKASKIEYDRLIGEWIAAGRPALPPARQTDVAVVELCAAYRKHAREYYRKNGRPTDTIYQVQRAIELLCEKYGRTLAVEFGPLAFQAFQNHLVSKGLSRKTINHFSSWVRRMFRWAATKELVPVIIYQALDAVPNIPKNRGLARETPPVKPVDDATVENTLPYLPPVVADMVRFQRLTGARPGEVCQLRPADVDRNGEVWRYRPQSHKTEHRDFVRFIFIGPKAQELLRPYLLRPADAYCFSPADSEKRRLEARHSARKTPAGWGNAPGANRRHRARRPRDNYTNDSYNRAVQRACELAFGMPTELRSIAKMLPEGERKRLQVLASKWRAEHCWSPNQLRHAAGTNVRRLFGLEAAQVVLGHARADVTQVYAERDQELAAQIMQKIG